MIVRSPSIGDDSCPHTEREAGTRPFGVAGAAQVLPAAAQQAMKPSRAWRAILDGKRNVCFLDVLRVAEAFGYRLHRVTGSYHILKHPRVADVLNLQPDRSGNAKPYQLRQLVVAVESHRLTMES